MTLYTKAIISNRYVEVTQQTYAPALKRTSLGGRKSFSNQNNENYETNLKISINRARKVIRRLLETNFTHQYAFITLTFRPSHEIDVTDMKDCYKAFAQFKKCLDYFLKKNQLQPFKYLGVTEFQDANRDGAIHYHLVCNLIEVSTETLQQLWQHGHLHRTLTDSSATENEKISSYLMKGIADSRLNNKKKYFRSQGLKPPITLEVENSQEFYNSLNGCLPKLLEGGTYNNPFFGEVKYENYYVENAKELIEYAEEI